MNSPVSGSSSAQSGSGVTESPLEILADELAGIADDVERELRHRLDAMVADAQRKLAEVDARFLERRFELVQFEAAVTSRIDSRFASLKDGSPGEKGEAGVDGKDGLQGPDGIDGKDGLNGIDGKDGSSGLNGIDGKDGAAGRDGVDGKDGLAGRDGKDGTPGERGAEGAPGKFDDLKPWAKGVHYESQLVTHKGATYCARRDTAEEPPNVDWDVVAARGLDAPVGQVRGLYDPESKYRQFDLVAFNGSEWRAKQDDPGPLPGEGWGLSAKQGKRGEKGERGDRGEVGKEGKQGPAGPTVVERKIQGFTLIDTLSDGSTIACDMRPAFERYHGEAW